MYTKQDYSHLLGLPGFSDKALETHFALYEGYVKNTNLLLEKLRQFNDDERVDSPEFAELKRRFGWEFNGMRLHEYYFSGLSTREEVDPQGKLYQAIGKNFGSFENWKRDFVATEKMRGIGWAVLYQDMLGDGKLINFWINEHDSGHGVGLNPILVIDLFEHAYMIDYGRDRPAYLEAYWNNIKWSEIEKRLK